VRRKRSPSQEMFPHDTAGFTVELWKPDTSRQKTGARYRGLATSVGKLLRQRIGLLLSTWRKLVTQPANPRLMQLAPPVLVYYQHHRKALHTSCTTHLPCTRIPMKDTNLIAIHAPKFKLHQPVTLYWEGRESFPPKLSSAGLTRRCWGSPGIGST